MQDTGFLFSARPLARDILAPLRSLRAPGRACGALRRSLRSANGLAHSEFQP
jgi:hypothetical protein